MENKKQINKLFNKIIKSKEEREIIDILTENSNSEEETIIKLLLGVENDWMWLWDS